MRVWPSISDGAATFGALISVLAGLFAMAFLGAFAFFVPLLLFPPVMSVRTGLIEIAVATAALYLVSNALKLLSKRRPGYHEDGASPLPQRRVSQPVLLAISFALAIVLVAYPAWWKHRLASREYEHSKTCYAQLETADRLTGFDAKFAPGYVEFKQARYLAVAEEHGAMLGMRRDAIDRDLGRTAAAFFKSYSALTPAAAQRNRPALLSDLTRCLNDDWAPHGEILNP